MQRWRFPQLILDFQWFLPIDSAEASVLILYDMCRACDHRRIALLYEFSQCHQGCHQLAADAGDPAVRLLGRLLYEYESSTVPPLSLGWAYRYSNPYPQPTAPQTNKCPECPDLSRLSRMQYLYSYCTVFGTVRYYGIASYSYQIDDGTLRFGTVRFDEI